MRAPLLFVGAIVLLAALACGGGSIESPTATPAVLIENDGAGTATVVISSSAGRHEELTVELALTPQERSRGLMARESLPEDHGMLFIFPEDTETGFWMKDTLIPLSIAFISAEGVIVDIQHMEPLSTELHRSAEPYRYALELNRGWFQNHGFETADRAEIPGSLHTLAE